MTQTSACERFLTLPWLADLNADAKTALLDCMREESAPPGTIFVEQGEPNPLLSFVVEGTVLLTRTYPDGHIERVASLSAPSVFGETAFFTGSPSLVRTKAMSQVLRLVLDHAGHERFRAGNPKAAEMLALAVVRLLADRFDIIDKRVSELTRHDHAKASELARFRTRLFEDATL